MMRRWLCLVLVMIAITTAVAVRAEGPTPEVVLDRVGAYLLDYEQRVFELVVDEAYSQWINKTRNSGSSAAAQRRLLSSFFIVRLPDGRAWYGLRDTFSVDGRPVGGDQQRMDEILRNRTDSAFNLALRIMHDNARFNLGPVYRTINLPFQALEILHPSRRARFRFKRAGEERIDGQAAWKIDFTEEVRPSLITTSGGDDVPARGSAWVNPVTGLVLRTEVRIGGRGATYRIPTTIRVEYARDARLDMFLPVEMRETYTWPRQVLHGRATYTNYRRFETSGRLVTTP
jgi:hypothetical protein